MADFATLVLGANTTGLRGGVDALDDVVVAGGRAEAATEKVATSFKKAGTAAKSAASGMKSMNTRNVALQLSQVAQQGAATGNYLQALAIQLPDLALGFGTIGIAAGAVAGALLPVGLSMLDLGDNAQKVDEVFGDLDNSLSTYLATTKIARSSLAELAERFGDNAAAVRENFQALAQLQSLEAVDALKDAIAEIEVPLQDVVARWQQVGDAAGDAGRNATARMERLSASLGLTVAEAATLSATFDALQAENTLEGATAAAQSLKDQLIAAYGEAALIPEPLRDAAQMAIKAATAGREIEASLDASAVAGSGAWSTADSLAASLAQASGFAAQLVAVLGQVPAAMAGLDSKVDGVLGGLEDRKRSLELQLDGFSTSAATLQAEQERVISSLGDNATLEDVLAVQDLYGPQIEKAQEYDTAIKGLNQSLADQVKAATGTGGGGGGAEGAVGELSDAMTELSEGEYAAAMRDLNDQFWASSPALQAVDDGLRSVVVNGLDGFDDMADGFKAMLAEMVYEAARNQIMLSLGLDLTGFGGGTAAKLATGAGGIGGGGGFSLSNMLGIGNLFGGGGGGLLSGIGSGLGGIFSGGGLGASFANLGGLFSGAASGLGAIGAALPALGIVGAGVGLVFSALVGKTRELDSGIRLTVDGFDAMIESFSKTETSRFFGLVKSRDSNFSELSEEDAEPFVNAIVEIQDGILLASDALGIAESAFDDFSHQVEVSTRGLSDEEAQAAVLEALGEISDEMAEMALAGYDVGLSGEGATDTLTRLATDLEVVNTALKVTGAALFDVGIEGAAAASEMSQALGGSAGFATAFDAFFTGFYTEAEQTAAKVAEIDEAFADLGMTAPQTRAEFRSLVEGLDLTTEGGREMYAELIAMAGALDDVLPSLSAFNEQMYGLVQETNSEIDDMISAAQDAAAQHAQAAQDWYRTSRELRDFMDDLMGSDLGGLDIFDQTAYNRQAYEDTLQAALGGDLDAASNLPAAARAYLESAQLTASTSTDYRLIAAEVQNATQLMAGVAGYEGARNDVLEDLYLQQIEVLEAFQAFLALEDLTEEQIALLDEDLQSFLTDFDGTLESFEDALQANADAIAFVNDSSYAALMQRAEVALDVILTDETLSPTVAALMEASVEGIVISIDTVLRSDLPPDLMWMAVNAESYHLLTVETLLADSSLSNAEMIDTLVTAGEITRTISILLESDDLTTDELRNALAATGNLARVISLTVDGSIPPELRSIALDNAGDYLVSIQTAVLPEVPAEIREMVLNDAGSYALIVETALTGDLSEAEAMLLLQTASTHVLNVQSILLSDGLSVAQQALLFEASSDALLMTTISLVYGDQFTATEIAVMQGDARSILSVVGKVTMDASRNGMQFIDALTDYTGQTTRTINGLLRMGDLSEEQTGFLKAISGANAGTVRLAGGVEIDPSTAFQNWYEDTTISSIADPMAALRLSIEDLRGAMSVMTAQQELAAAEAALASAYSTRQGMASSNAALISEIEALEAATGVQLVNANGGDAALGVNANGNIVYDAAAVSHSAGSDLDAFSEAFWSEGGLEDQLLASQSGFYDMNRTINALRRQIESLGGVPAFESGGMHDGGWAVVGEKGPELAYFDAPAQIYSASQSQGMMAQSDAQMAKLVAIMERSERNSTLQMAKLNDRMRKSMRIAEENNIVLELIAENTAT